MVKYRNENFYKLTKPRFIAALFAFIFGIIYILLGAGLLFLVYNYESYGISAYGLISPGLFSLGTGLFQITAFIFRHNKNLLKTCSLFSLVCAIGVAVSFTIIYTPVLNPLGCFLGSLLFFLPIIICQIVILTIDIFHERKNGKIFNIARGESRNKKKPAHAKVNKEV